MPTLAGSAGGRAMQGGRGLGAHAIGLALVLVWGAVAAAEARAAEGRRWTVAPAGPCATPRPSPPRAGAACAANTPVRARFDPRDVATRETGPGGAAAPPTL